MAALDAWMALPLGAAAAALVLVGRRLWLVAFRAALDGPSFSRAVAEHLTAGRIDRARALAEQLRPAWAAELVLRTLDARSDPTQLRYALDETRAELELAAQQGLLAIRSLGRIALPLALAISIVELATGFAPAPDRVQAAGLAFSRGLFAMSVGLATAFVCQLSYGLLAREGSRRLREVQLAGDAVARAEDLAPAPPSAS